MDKTITIERSKNLSLKFGCLLEDETGPESFDWFGTLEQLQEAYPDYEIIDITEYTEGSPSVD